MLAKNTMIQTFNLTGKVILITGGYGYLGKAATESLVHHGGTVYVLGRSEEKSIAAFSRHPENGKRLLFQKCDVSKTESIVQAYSVINEQENGIDVLINNAFYLDGQHPLTMTDDQWQTGIDGTLNSVFRCIREAIPYLMKSETPRIINVSSMYGVVAPDFSVYEDYQDMLNPPHYGAAKAGVVQLSKYYASYLGKEGITVNTITPGPYPPESVQEKKKFILLLREKTLLKRIGKPEDLAGAFVFLASDASAYITGQNIVVDGGWTAK
jgi:NAD(P)-dependent dehydrogenase (short-subunit alcohol dehydrogenase family)